MLQNKIYQNFFIEIAKTFLLILFGLSVIALTVRSVSFLDLIVDSGYSVSTYFKYSLLNLFGITPKFIPLAFMLSLTIFILKHIQDSEFIILWTSGVKKLNVINLFLFTSIITLIFYLVLSTFLTPLALNKSRQLLSQEQFNSFLPTVRTQQFSDSFKGFTFLVEKKVNNELKNIFLHDDKNNLKNLSSNISKTKSTTIIAENGIVEKNKLFLLNGQIISSKKDESKNEVIKFEQLTINLGDLNTSTIKVPKLQEISTIELLACLKKDKFKNELCNTDLNNEIISNLNRRFILPLYIPVISLICSFLLVKSKRNLLNKISVYFLCFVLLILLELTVRYTGINHYLRNLFVISPVVLVLFLYSFLILRLSKETKSS